MAVGTMTSGVSEREGQHAEAIRNEKDIGKRHETAEGNDQKSRRVGTGT